LRKNPLALLILLPVLLFLIFSPAACVDRLPDQDLRITTAVPVTKLPAELLWQEFEKDPSGSAKRYFGRAIDLTGKITSLEAGGATGPFIFFAQSEKGGVRASLLADRAAETLKDLQPGARVNLKCFCEGLKTDVILKSCIRP
jgi:tRNA_anti-like